MAKPRTRKISYINRQIDDLDTAFTDPADAKFKRTQKKLLKRARKKHERGVQRRELRQQLDD